jgi:NET1-associated nuclear protein 1 (U3 small nucleolar RNA-associated protein 17)
VTFDATETRVAGGDENGRILIWENVGEHKFSSRTEKGGKEKKSQIVHEHPTTNSATTTTCPGVRGSDDAAALTKYHWHSREVQFLIFSSDGVYLLSGGLEGVLVIWQLETGKCQFLPRLGGPLVSIAASPNPSLYAIACLDNAVKFVNIGTLSIERSIQGIKPPVPFPKNVKLHSLRASIEPHATQNISLQFYDTANDQHVGELQVVPRNYLSEGKSKNRTPQLPSTFVSHVAFSADGTSMATVDIGIPEQGIGGGACLKFWDRPSQQLQYSVNTQVDELHGQFLPMKHLLYILTISCIFSYWVCRNSFRL